MSWGVSSWGLHVWGGGASGENLSFEVAESTGDQGEADKWEVASASAEVDAGTFEHVGQIWDAWEDLEELWQMPFLVHAEADSTQVLTSPVPTTWATCATLLNEAIDNFGAHILTIESIHRSKDTSNYFSAPTLAAADTAAITFMTNVLKNGLNDHMDSWPGVHGKWDYQNLITTVDASDLATTIALLTEIRTDMNAHVVLMGYGATNSDAIFAFLTSHLTAGAFLPDLLVEGFERLWDLRMLYPTLAEQLLLVTIDGPGTYTIVVDSVPDDTDYFILGDGDNEVTFEFDTNSTVTDGNIPIDISAAGTVTLVRAAMTPVIIASSLELDVEEPTSDSITLERTDGGRLTADIVQEGTAADHLTSTLPEASWPDGHIEFFDVFEYLLSERGVLEPFSVGWYLPGSDTDWPNDTFAARYLSDGVFAFEDHHLSVGIVEDFESDWRDNDVGLAAYWSGTEWRFLTSHLALATFDLYTFGDYDLSTGVETIEASITPDYSPDLSMHVTTAFLDAGQFWLEFYDKNGATQYCYWFIDSDDKTLAKEITDVGLTSIASDPRYDFTQQFNGIKQIKDMSKNFPTPVGAVEFRGTRYVAETFESGWTLTL